MEIAARHHEKLNGSGYPDKLTAAELTLPQRIMAVADIASALYSRRSYREKMPKYDVLKIVGEMAGNGQLDSMVVSVMTEKYDEMIEAGAARSSDIICRYEALKAEYARRIGTHEAGSANTRVSSGFSFNRS